MLEIIFWFLLIILGGFNLGKSIQKHRNENQDLLEDDSEE